MGEVESEARVERTKRRVEMGGRERGVDEC